MYGLKVVAAVEPVAGRSAWGLGEDPIPDLVRILERREVVATRLEFEGRCRCVFVGKRPAAAGDPRDR